MEPTYYTPDEVDNLLKLPPGKAARLARRGMLPAVILPDRSIRFERATLQNFLNRQQRPEPPAAGRAVAV